VSRGDFGPCRCGGCDSCLLAQGVDPTPCAGCTQINHDLDVDGYCGDCAAEIELAARALDEIPEVLRPNAFACGCSTTTSDDGSGLCDAHYYAVFR